jgi:hypothetical protein
MLTSSFTGSPPLGGVVNDLSIRDASIGFQGDEAKVASSISSHRRGINEGQWAISQSNFSLVTTAPNDLILFIAGHGS